MNQFISIKEASIFTGKSDITIRRLIKRLLNQDHELTSQVINRESTPSGIIYKIKKEFLAKELKMDYLLNNQMNNPSNQSPTHSTNQEDSHSEQVINQTTNQEKDEAEFKAKEAEQGTAQNENPTTHSTSQKNNPPDQATTQTQTGDSNKTIEILQEVIGLMREQLQAKDLQLAAKHEENQELIRGNRESIATINVLTQRLMLTEKASEPQPEVITKPRAKTEEKKKQEPTPSPEQGTAKPAKQGTKPQPKKKSFFGLFN
jgi:hypothetical protein